MQKWTIEFLARRLRETSSKQKRLITAKVQEYFSAQYKCNPDGDNPDRSNPDKDDSDVDSYASLSQALDSIQTLVISDSGIEITLKRMNYLDDDERRLIWMRADKASWKSVCREFDSDRATLWRKWALALTKICAYLNAQGASGVHGKL